MNDNTVSGQPELAVYDKLSALSCRWNSSHPRAAISREIRLQAYFMRIDSFFSSYSFAITHIANMSADDPAKASQDAEKELTRLWRAWRTVKEMCADRVALALLLKTA